MPQTIKAVLFDMDGTLVDSERLTERALLALLADAGQAVAGLDLVQFHGVTWKRIGERLLELFPSLGADPVAVAHDIEARFQRLFESEPPDLIPGADAAFRAAAVAFPGRTTIVTGSEARAVEALLDRTGWRSLCAGYTSCDQYQRSKPDPQSYLLAARRLGVAAADCIVFEDSGPGLQAAGAAGMRRVAVTRGEPARIRQAAALADMAVDDYTLLPGDFFAALAAD